MRWWSVVRGMGGERMSGWGGWGVEREERGKRREKKNKIDKNKIK